MHVGLDAVHNLLQVFNPVRVDAIGLHGVVDAALNPAPAVHSQRLDRVGIGRHALGFRVQRRNGKEDVDIGLFQVRLDGFHIGIGP